MWKCTRINYPTKSKTLQNIYIEYIHDQALGQISTVRVPPDCLTQRDYYVTPVYHAEWLQSCQDLPNRTPTYYNIKVWETFGKCKLIMKMIVQNVLLLTDWIWTVQRLKSGIEMILKTKRFSKQVAFFRYFLPEIALDIWSIKMFKCNNHLNIIKLILKNQLTF